MLRNLIHKVANPRNELIRYLNYYMIKEIEHHSNTHVKEYLKSCLRQSMEYYKLFETANIEISPLLGFYSLLNLSKVITMLRLKNYSISLSDVESKFSSHGASSSSIDDIKINKKGTFYELTNSKPHYSSRVLPTKISLVDLYKMVPDCFPIYNELFPNKSKLLEVKMIEDYMSQIHTIDPSVNLNGVAILSVNKSEIINKYSSDFNFINYHDHTLIYIKDNIPKNFKDYLLVNSDKKLYLSIETTINLMEEEILYLIFLKYSSLVRYKPKNWNEKINNDEYSIITKILDESVTKFWSIITKDFINDNNYII